MGLTSPPWDRRELGRVFRDRRAAEALGQLVQPAAHQHLEFDCSQVMQIDAYGAVVILAALDAHLSADPRHQAMVREPDASEIGRSSRTPSAYCRLAQNGREHDHERLAEPTS